jgi:CheY-like chemotaxis protein
LIRADFKGPRSALKFQLNSLSAGVAWDLSLGGSGRPAPDEAPACSESLKTSHGGKPLVLVVEDNRADVFLVERAVESCNLAVNLQVVEDGEEALKYLERAESDGSAPCPSVMLLDLNLPRRSGREILQWVRQAKRCQNVPVIILTSSNSPEDRRETAALGATRYFRKPTSYQEFLKIGEILGEVLKESTA